MAGVDEAGRGALLGPVAAGVVVLPYDLPDLFDQLDGVRDSKEMTPEEREQWAIEIKRISVCWAVGYASAAEIDQIGILPSTYLAATRALGELSVEVEHILIDYITLPDIVTPQTPLVKGDARSLSIAAASVLAKTERDAILVSLDGDYPGYHLASNKGYGTVAHRAAIKSLGPCVLHRHTFSPIAEKGEE